MKTVLTLVAASLLLAGPAFSRQQAPAPGLASETPAVFKPNLDRLNYERREVMIPMRDGVKLHTRVFTPKTKLCRHCLISPSERESALTKGAV